MLRQIKITSPNKLYVNVPRGVPLKELPKDIFCSWDDANFYLAIHEETLSVCNAVERIKNSYGV